MMRWPTLAVRPLRPAEKFGTILPVTPPDRLRPIVATGIFFFWGDTMKPYTKTPKSNADLATLIKSRGIIGDSDALIRILETVGYYRFTGYLHPFRIPNSEAYRSNTTLDIVWSIYMFDRHLRLMAMDALARIEIAIRAIITRCHTDFIGNPFAFVTEGWTRSSACAFRRMP